MDAATLRAEGHFQKLQMVVDFSLPFNFRVRSTALC